MDTRDGRIYSTDEMLARFDSATIERHFRPIDPTPAQATRKPPRVGNNEPCPCGSGKKFKKCCKTIYTGNRPAALVEH